MSGAPDNPPLARYPIPPPQYMLPWGAMGQGGQVYLNQNSYDFLSQLWAALQGNGGTVSGLLLALDNTTRGQLAAFMGNLPFGASFTCADVSTKALGAVVARFPVPLGWIMPVDLVGSTGKVETAPGATTDFDLQVDGVSIGTASWAAGETVPTFTKAATTTAVFGDWLDLVTPPNLNGMSGAFGLTIMGRQA